LTALREERTLDIDEIRKEIDRLDNELLRIFNERASLALAIGEIKKAKGIPVYDPGPLEDGAIVRLFERVIDESRRLERIRTKGI